MVTIDKLINVVIIVSRDCKFYSVMLIIYYNLHIIINFSILNSVHIIKLVTESDVSNLIFPRRRHHNIIISTLYNNYFDIPVHNVTVYYHVL